MAWTTPITWTTNQLVAASDMNAQIRDNENYLFSGRPGSTIKYDAGASYTTTSTSFVDIDATNISITLTISSGRALVMFMSVSDAQVQNGAFDISVDGTRIGSAGTNGISASFMTNAVDTSTTTIGVVVTGLSVGSHTFRPQWRKLNGTATMFAGNGVAQQDFIPVFSVIEV
jgi:hypothetical protein